MSSQLLAIKNLSRAQSNGDYFLHPFDVCITAGESIGICGTSGSGKSILLRAIAQLDCTDSESIHFLNNKIDDASIPYYRSKVQLVHQNTMLFDSNVLENIRLPQTFTINKKQHFNCREIYQALDFFKLPHSFLQQKSITLSGGERNIVNILRSLSLSPHILLLDEPTAALDSEASLRVEDYIRHWLSEKPDERAYLWISHSTKQIQRVTQKLWYVDNGIVSINNTLKSI
ncbi:MAG: ATP-binding cassette domain-containing protein [Gammaproteobacteria bacterium]|nr:ATP-binding cassette domain-containing protein [Gammaproteobacteria bacterium]